MGATSNTENFRFSQKACPRAPVFSGAYMGGKSLSTAPDGLSAGGTQSSTQRVVRTLRRRLPEVCNPVCSAKCKPRRNYERNYESAVRKKRRLGTDMPRRPVDNFPACAGDSCKESLQIRKICTGSRVRMGATAGGGVNRIHPLRLPRAHGRNEIISRTKSFGCQAPACAWAQQETSSQVPSPAGLSSNRDFPGLVGTASLIIPR